MYQARNGDQHKKCPVCLKGFWAQRRTAVYCSATCRQRAHRKPAMEARIGQFYDDAHSAILSLIAVGDRGLEGFRASKRLQTLALQIVEHMSDQTRRQFYEQIKDDFYRLRDS